MNVIERERERDRDRAQGIYTLQVDFYYVYYFAKKRLHNSFLKLKSRIVLCT
jgi:hypothetical protein